MIIPPLRLERREFLKTIAAAGAGAAIAPIGALAESRSNPTFVPSGELGARLAMTARRLTGAGVPTYTNAFVLADAALSPDRRFNEFSGDLSGRYLGALATLPATGSATRLPVLAASLISHQRHDGRFGRGDLAFTADVIGPPHMALLWGNGRLLVGLLEYHARHHDAAVLTSARRLGDFLVAVRRQCAQPAVARRVEGQGAFGFICFTQLIEGLVLLAQQTGDKRYLDTAAEIVPLLPPRGVQHSHGYLTTLRGVLALHEATHDPRHLSFVSDRYRDLLASRDYTPYGGVLEYFGWEDPTLPASARSSLVDASGGHPRDEGCSEADFVRLALGLWRATHDVQYLEHAERALVNSLYPNQFDTGDFGSRVTFARGFMPTESVARCWWCCTMHGYRALADVLDSVVTNDADGLRLNLFEEGTYSDGRDRVTTRRIAADDTMKRPALLYLVVPALTGPVDRPLAIREPAWASEMLVRINGKRIAGDRKDGYVWLSRKWSPIDRVEVELRPRARLVTRDGRGLEPSALKGSPVEGVLSYGPWVLAVDEASDPLFFGEPWPENVVLLAAAPEVRVEPPGAQASATPLTIRARYEHGGFGGTHPVTLRPLSAQTRGPQRILATWIKYRAQG
jgi:DUF1680 family protein